MQEKQRTASISRFNDLLRTQGIGGRVIASIGVQNLHHDVRANVVEAIRVFDGFGGDNDPYGEHDFGAVEVGGEKYFFKIDYYDPSLQYGSDDPADPSKTVRVMTVMREDEY